MEQGFRYYNPVSLVFGEDALTSILRQLNERRALLVASEGGMQRPLIQQLLNVSTNIVSVVSAIRPNPELQDLQEILDTLPSEEYEVIIAVGGGSVIDSAKAISLRRRGDKKLQLGQLLKQGAESVNQSIPIIAVPTTTGSGSEVTPWATIWDSEACRKYSLHRSCLWPEAAICDPQLSVTLSRELTMQTGLDALSHALESIWNRNANPVTIRHAVSAAKRLFTTLPLIVEDLENPNLRTQMMLGSLEAGLAFSNTGTSLAHSISYYLTLKHNIPHGVACSFSLPEIVDAVAGKDSTVDEALTAIFGSTTSKPLRAVWDALELRKSFNEFGITKVELPSLYEIAELSGRSKNSILDLRTFCIRENLWS